MNGLKPTAASRLVRRGHTPATQGINPKTKATQLFLSPSDIAAFHEHFVTLRGLGNLLGLNWQSLRYRLGDAGSRRFSPDGEDCGALYAWEAIETTFVCRWPNPKDADPI